GRRFDPCTAHQTELRSNRRPVRRSLSSSSRWIHTSSVFSLNYQTSLLVPRAFHCLIVIRCARINVSRKFFEPHSSRFVLPFSVLLSLWAPFGLGRPAHTCEAHRSRQPTVNSRCLILSGTPVAAAASRFLSEMCAGSPRLVREPTSFLQRRRTGKISSVPGARRPRSASTTLRF